MPLTVKYEAVRFFLCPARSTMQTKRSWLSGCGCSRKADPVALRRDENVRQVALGLVEHLADGVFDAITAVDGVDRGESLAVGRPVGRTHVFEHLAGGSARQRNAGERPEAGFPSVRTTERDGQLVGGDRETPAGKIPRLRDSELSTRVMKISLGFPSQAAE